MYVLDITVYKRGDPNGRGGTLTSGWSQKFLVPNLILPPQCCLFPVLEHLGTELSKVRKEGGVVCGCMLLNKNCMH